MKRTEPTEQVSQCCGGKYSMKAVISVTYADGTVLEPEPRSPVPVCDACDHVCKIVLKGEEMKPSVGGIYCQNCSGKLCKSGRVPKDLALRYPVQRAEGKGTCWGCGTTVELREASEIVRKE